jgi:hypothetical protein
MQQPLVGTGTLFSQRRFPARIQAIGCSPRLQRFFDELGAEFGEIVGSLQVLARRVQSHVRSKASHGLQQVVLHEADAP